MPTLTDDQRERFLALCKDDPKIGNIRHMKTVRPMSRRGECRQLLDDDLIQDAREARGWTVEPIVQNLHAMACDPSSPHAVRAATLILNGPHGEPGWQPKSGLELTGAGGGPVEIADRSATLNDVADVLTASGAFDRGDDDPAALAASGDPVAEPGEV